MRRLFKCFKQCVLRLFQNTLCHHDKHFFAAGHRLPDAFFFERPALVNAECLGNAKPEIRISLRYKSDFLLQFKKELGQKKELVEIRLASIQKQEKQITDKAKALQEELIGSMKK